MDSFAMFVQAEELYGEPVEMTPELLAEMFGAESEVAHGE